MTTATDITWDDIDPTAIVDDDGQAYLIWGNTVCYWARLKSNMIELDSPIGTFNLPDFTEAPFIHKRNNLYYLSYAAGWPERIEYATASSITGPWTHRGAIISQTLQSETNHQSIVQYNGIWYFTYHNAALEGGGPYNRSVCIDVLNYNSDGTIRPVTMTSEGVASIGAAPFKTNTNYKIKAEHSGKLLEVANASSDNSANVRQYTDNGNYCQQWSLKEVGNGLFEIINRNSGLVLDTDLSNDNVIQYASWGGDNQKWKLAGTDNGTFFIVNLASNDVLDVLNAGTGDGANVQHWVYNGLTCQ
jgi:beta-xylosidase